MASTLAQSSQKSKASGGTITGMRSWIGVSVRLAGVVTMAAVSISSPFGPIQVSHRPAKAIGCRRFGRTTNGRLRSPCSVHS